MKAKLLIILGLVAIFIIVIFVRFFILDTKNASGKIKIVSSPAANVFIDSVSVGKTPYEINNQPVGEYVVKLIPDEADKNTVAWEGTIPVYKNTLTYVSRDMGTSELTSGGEVLTVVRMENTSSNSTGEVQVETDPPGAIIYLDNDEKGVAPIVLQDVPEGDHELAVYLPGFFRRSQKIRVEKGFQVKAQFKLALDQTHKSLADELEAQRAEASKEAALEDAEENVEDETPASLIEVLDTEVGYLNVRSEPSVNGDRIAQINPGEQYEYTESENGWYQIILNDGEVGWVSGDYVTEVEE